MISASAQLASTSVQSMFCTYRIKKIAQPAWKIAQTRLSRLCVFPSNTPMLHIRDTVTNAPMLNRCIFSLRVVLEARGGCFSDHIPTSLFSAWEKIFPQVSPITMLIDYVYSFRTQDKGVVECSGQKRGASSYSYVNLQIWPLSLFALRQDKSTKHCMHNALCHMSHGGWQVVCFQARMLLAPRILLCHTAMLLCVSCQTVGILRLWYVTACI